MTISQALKTNNTNEWPTPQWLFDLLDLEFGFTLDPCCTDESAKCGRYFTARDNGLIQDWANDSVFMNPPYGGHIKDWMAKAFSEADSNGALVVCLVPARVDTAWWHSYAVRGEIRFPIGRLKFEGADSCAPFPVAIIIFRAKKLL